MSSGIFVQSCKDCDEIKKLVNDIDLKIEEITKNSVLNKKYLTNKPVNKRILQDLIYYREIAINLQWDSSYYYPDFNRKEIVSKIKTLTINTYRSHPGRCKPGTAPTTSVSSEGYLLSESGQPIIPE